MFSIYFKSFKFYPAFLLCVVKICVKFIKALRFCIKFCGSVSLRKIPEGGQSAIGNLKNLDLSRAPSKSNISDIRMLRGALNSLETFLCPLLYFGQHGELNKRRGI